MREAHALSVGNLFQLATRNLFQFQHAVSRSAEKTDFLSAEATVVLPG